MNIHLKILIIIFINFSIFSISCKREKTIIQSTETFQFPKIDSIDSAVYAQIKETCRNYWDLNEMIADTFEIIKYGTEYLIHCDGYLEGKLYQFFIRVDKNGNWINDGMILNVPNP